MAQTTPARRSGAKPAEIVGDPPPIQLLPDEDPAEYRDLRAALLGELAPGTPYELLLVEQLIALEWEARRHRRLRDSLLSAEFRDQAAGAFADREVGRLMMFSPDKESQNLARDLVAPDDKRRSRARTALADLEITPSEILAKAYASIQKDLEPHERHIAEIDGRRRRLRDDYDRLKAARLHPVEDAEVVDET